VTESAADVLAELPDHPLPTVLPGLAEPAPGPPALPVQALGSVRAEMLRLLSSSPTEIDVVIRHSQFAPAAVMAALSQLELALRVEILPGSRVALLGATAI
jgi:predicted Rossmann fold nucleotide-binding protein DprA/Smf involved in DNA uptake